MAGGEGRYGPDRGRSPERQTPLAGSRKTPGKFWGPVWHGPGSLLRGQRFRRVRRLQPAFAALRRDKPVQEIGGALGVGGGGEDGALILVQDLQPVGQIGGVILARLRRGEVLAAGDVERERAPNGLEN